ncbi:MAG: DUF3179 domain-containing protein [bacterium]|nr:DUF3179 domain-containing protein [bacterium]MCP5068920.1 DUF3179 domain-containing protein [bacterium]
MARLCGALARVGLGLAALGWLACAEPPAPTVEAGREAALLEALVSEQEAVQEQALAEIEAAGDQRFVAPLIELVRAGQLGIAGRVAYNQRVIALERLSGKELGGDWFGWAEWFSSTDLTEPPGFAGWKGRLLSPLEPRYLEILTNDAPTAIRVAEIDWGGVPIDGIPPLETPEHVPAADADHMKAAEPVIGVAVGGASRAYPLRILDWHELVNDTLGGIPLTLAYCTLCGSGIVYDGRVAGLDEPLRFGTSGLLYRSNKLMYDRSTTTLWSQLTGRPVLGELVGRNDLELELLPAVVTRWGDWKLRNPDTTVLTPNTGHDRSYEPGEPYGGYFASRDKLFPVFQNRDELAIKDRIFGLVDDGHAKAWDLGKLVQSNVTNDEFAGRPLVLVATSGRIDVEGFNAQARPVRYDVGGAVRAYATPGPGFRLGPDDQSLLDAEGQRWQITEEALISPTGARAPRRPGTLAYWFAWQAFHPKTELPK